MLTMLNVGVLAEVSLAAYIVKSSKLYSGYHHKPSNYFQR